MSKKTRRTRRMRNMLLVVSMMLVVAMASVGVTVAWLTDKTDEIVNTFTASDIAITLSESDSDGTPYENSYKMVPGQTIAKDPTVKVQANSEACWLFVKLVKANEFDTFLSYTVADGWTEVETGSGVYYRKVDSSAEPQAFAVLKDNQVNVLDSVTKAQLNALNAETNPTLTVTAYAVQQASFADAQTAWAEAVKLDKQ